MKTAYPVYQGTVQIRLYSNIPFDNTYKHHSLISDKFTYNDVKINSYSGTEPKERFIDRLDYTKTGNPYYYPRYDISGEFNFDYSNGLVTSVVLELTPQQTNANYMRIKSHDTNGSEYYYYFITGISQINADTYRLTLELDVLMTYQDEFLEGMNGVPVFTQRKHCHRYDDNGDVIHCADLKAGEDTFAGVKPTIITDLKNLTYNNTQMKTIKDVKWLYVCCDGLKLRSGDTDIAITTALYTASDITYPMTILAIPLNIKQLIIKSSDSLTTITYSNNAIKIILDNLIGSGIVHGTKLSNFPPFTTGHFTLSSGVLTITADSNFSHNISANLNDFYMGNNILTCQEPASGATFNLSPFLKDGALLLIKQNDMMYKSNAIEVNANFDNDDPPTPLVDRYIDPKLFFAPFTKYVLSAKYSSDGCEYYPELMFSEYAPSNTTQSFEMFATGFIGDNSYYTRPTEKTISGETAFANYNYAKIGLAGTTNYSIPAGEDALDVFNATQAQAFYQSKTASGITSGLSILGGAGSIALGIVGAVGSMGMSAPASAGLIAGGVTAVAGGIASVSNTIKSTQAKIEDLKNTPDSINISGSSFTLDSAITNSSPLPYLIRYECASVIKENANDYFYNYGYQVARECYFNLDLRYIDASHKVDTDLIGRTIFNYIQLNDDIVNKINYDMPLIVKQKLSKIFNDGITLWSWFGLPELWGAPAVPTSSYYLDRWFMKCDLDNTEYNVLINNA